MASRGIDEPAAHDDKFKGDAEEDDGVAPLLVACAKGELEEALLLINNGTDVNGADERGFTPLFVAAGEGRRAVAEALIAAGANVDLASKKDAPPLLVACQGGHVDVVRLLLDRGANIRQADDGGQTPLLIACKAISAREADERKRCVEIARLLLERSVAPAAAHAARVHKLADWRYFSKGLPSLPAITCCGGWTPLDQACEEVDLELVQLLLQYCKSGDDFASEFESKDGDWHDVLNTALKGRRDDLVQGDRERARQKAEIAKSLIARRYPKYTPEQANTHMIRHATGVTGGGAGGKKSRKRRTKRRHKTGGKKSRRRLRKRATIKGGKRKRRRTRRRR